MKRWIRSLGCATRAQSTKQAAPRTMIQAEPLENRQLMSSVLSADLNRFSNSPSAPPTSTVPNVYVPPTQIGGILEDHDRMSKANKKSLDFSADGKIKTQMTVEMFKFSAKAGQSVAFDVDLVTGSALDSVMRLFDPSGVEIAYSDDQAAPNEVNQNTFESYFEYTFTTKGNYYVAVSASGNDAYHPISGLGDVKGNSTGKYKLKAKVLPPPDTNDQISEAQPVTTDSVITGKITKGDVDMYAITVVAGQVIGFDTELLGVDSPVDTRLRLFDVDGNELASSDDDLSPNDFEGVNFYGESYIEYTFDTDGTYYIAVSASDNDAYDPTTGTGDLGSLEGNYTLRFFDLT